MNNKNIISIEKLIKHLILRIYVYLFYDNSIVMKSPVKKILLKK
jgi:hypothetical protein